jgi:hypothetical protein
VPIPVCRDRVQTKRDLIPILASCPDTPLSIFPMARHIAQ